MKVKQVNEKQGFEPITLEITIESEQELCSLWHRLNESAGIINNNLDNALKHKCDESLIIFFKKIDVIVESKDLYK